MPLTPIGMASVGLIVAFWFWIVFFEADKKLKLTTLAMNIIVVASLLVAYLSIDGVQEDAGIVLTGMLMFSLIFGSMASILLFIVWKLFFFVRLRGEGES